MRVLRDSPRRRRLLAVGVLGLLVAAGVAAAANPQKSVTNYVAYVNGKAGAAKSKLSPITIGYLNQEGGPIVIGKTTDVGVATAAKWINTHAGGIGGHPLKVVNCFVASAEEEGQKCDQSFANNKKVLGIVTGAVAIGNESFFSAIGGSKPVISRTASAAWATSIGRPPTTGAPAFRAAAPSRVGQGA